MATGLATGIFEGLFGAIGNFFGGLFSGDSGSGTSTSQNADSIEPKKEGFFDGLKNFFNEGSEVIADTSGGAKKVAGGLAEVLDDPIATPQLERVAKDLGKINTAAQLAAAVTSDDPAKELTGFAVDEAIDKAKGAFFDKIGVTAAIKGAKAVTVVGVVVTISGMVLKALNNTMLPSADVVAKNAELDEIMSSDFDDLDSYEQHQFNYEQQRRNAVDDAMRQVGPQWGNNTSDPIILDLDQDGIDVSFGTNAAFDYDGDGFREQTAWAAPDDGFLVVDLDEHGEISDDGGDGAIDQANELAFARWTDGDDTDLQALAEARDADGNLIFDSNGDGVLDTKDDVWGSMKVFQDLDQDGEVDAGELKTLDEWGISQINLSYDEGGSFAETDDDISVLGNTLHGLASFVMNGVVVEGGVGDVSLAYNQFGWRRVETDTGYRIEFESGDDFGVWNAEGLASPDIDLAAGDIDAAVGDDRANVIDGSESDKELVISGGGGDDTILGGSNDDLISGGDGSDTVNAGAGNDVVFADAADNVAGGAVHGGDGFDQLMMADDAALDIADLSATGFEAVEAGGLADQIGGGADDVNYYLSGNGGDDELASAGGEDILVGGDGNDVLSSGAGSDRVFGGAGNDAIDAGDDDDFIAGGQGDDALRGGSGDDRYFYARGDGHDTILDQAFDTYVTRGEGETDYTYNVRVAHKSGKRTRYVNEMRTGYVATTVLGEAFGEVDGGIDTLEFVYGIDVEDVLFGMDGDDARVSFRNVDDADTAVDESQSVATGDSVTIEDWTDTNNRIENFEFANGIVFDMSQILAGQTGHGANDTLQGSDVGDWINAGSGDDVVNGAGGDDVLIGHKGNDQVNGGDGDDFAFGGEGADTIDGGTGDDYLIGEAGDDTVKGGAGGDVLFGETGDDVLQGGSGDDVLLGGAGADRLEGGAGDDTYIYFRGDGHDAIHDYADEMQQVTENTGNYYYQRSGKRGRWVAETRTVTKAMQVDGGWDVLQFGATVNADDLYFQLANNNLAAGIREIDADGNAVELTDLSDVVTVEDWSNSMSKVEELRFGDGLALDVSEVENVISGHDEANTVSTNNNGSLVSTGGGDDAISTGAGKDFVFAGDGDDTITLGDGDDDAWGGDGGDTIDGGAGKDYLRGDAGDDTLNGGDGDDVMIGGTGDDQLNGGRGNDVYFFRRGDGHDTIDESAVEEITTNHSYWERQRYWGIYGRGEWGWVWGRKRVTVTNTSIQNVEGGDDTLQFGNYIDLHDLIVNTLDGALEIELKPVDIDAAVTDQVTIKGWDSEAFRVETTRFANDFEMKIGDIDFAKTGTDAADVISAADMTDGTKSVWLVGGNGDDYLIGSDHGDILVGGKGDDRLEGGKGDDTYVYSRGDGHDTIYDSGSNAVGADPENRGGDTLLFGSDIAVENLVFETDGNNLLIYVFEAADTVRDITTATDIIEIENWSSDSNRIELMKFFDGMEYDISDIAYGRVADGTSVLNGSGYGDWLSGSSLADVINGHNGDDFFFTGDGDDTVHGGDGDDSIYGQAGDDVVDAGSGDDLVDGGSGDDALDGGSGDDIVMGGAGDDTINGSAGDDRLLGDKGDDTIVASAGQDLIRFGFGDGNDTYLGDTTHNKTDVIWLEDDVKAEDLWFERDTNDLLMRMMGAEDTITFKDWYNGNDIARGVKGFATADEYLDSGKVQSLVDTMKDHIADLNDGTSAYGITLDDAPESVLDAIEAAWAA